MRLPEPFAGKPPGCLAASHTCPCAGDPQSSHTNAIGTGMSFEKTRCSQAAYRPRFGIGRNSPLDSPSRRLLRYSIKRAGLDTTDEDSPSPRPSPSMRPLRYPFPLDGEGRDGGEKGFTARFHSLPASPWIPAFAGMTELFKGLLDGEGVSMPSPRLCSDRLRHVQHESELGLFAVRCIG